MLKKHIKLWCRIKYTQCTYVNDVLSAMSDQRYFECGHGIKRTLLVLFITAACLGVAMLQFNKFTTTPKLMSFNEVLRYFYATEEVGEQNNQPLPESELACKFPVLDPWDASIQQYIKHLRSFNCTQVQAQGLAYLDDSGFLHLNRTTLSDLERDLQQSVRCEYAILDAKNDMRSSTYEIAHGALTDQIYVTHDIVEVKCRSYKQGLTKGTLVYYNLFAYPATLAKSFGATSETQLSILLFVVDSVSYSMMRRNLPSTYEYLTTVMKIHMFNGFSKIGDNSFPNMIAMLTGKRARNETDTMQSEFPRGYKSKGFLFDNWDIIWKRYSQRQYVTLFHEDSPELGLFTYMMQGFSAKPTDHYYRAFWNKVRFSPMRKNYTSLCFGNRPKPEIQLDILRRFLVKYNGVRQFAYQFFTELAHNVANQVEKADELFLRFFTEMYEGGYLNRTVLFFLSDHGHRFSAVRRTAIGLIEERMPAFGIAFPTWFYKLYPNVRRNLRTNQMRLSTHFDTYETLLDILDERYDNVQRKSNARGMSQLYEISVNRTCEEAGIPEYFCVCQETRAIPTNDSLAHTASLALVEHINSLLKEHTSVCTNLSFSNTIHAEILGVNDLVVNSVRSNANVNKTGRVERFLFNLRVTVEVEPSAAIFEATVQCNNHTAACHAPDDISRVNRYGEQSACIDDAILRKYCWCRLRPRPYRHKTD